MVEIVQKKSKDYRFTLKSESGSVILSSVLFENEKEAKLTIKKLKTIQQKSNAFERKTNHNGKFVFHLKKRNGEIIGKSQPYASEAGMENGIKNVKRRIQDLSNLNQL